MKKFLYLLVACMLSACTTTYILVDENGNPIEEPKYIERGDNDISGDDVYIQEADLDGSYLGERVVSAQDVFVVEEDNSSVTYQYKNVRVDEISPLATLYCSDINFGGSPYLREVSMYHNGFMRATFDCVNIAI